MTDDWQVPPRPIRWDVTIPTDDASITRRRRALAPIQVIADIERTKTQLDGDFWQRYDLFTIALSVIDQVALAMGISEGRTWEETIDYAATQAARQVPDATAAELTAVAERVVVSLVTIETEEVPYLAHTDAGPKWLAQRFRLLYVHSSGADGAEHLRASEQVINIFVQALDLDIEEAQIANEAQLAALIKRGAVASAVQIAQHARYRSIQFQERIRRIIADTLIDPDTHDWVDDVPNMLGAALTHVRDRLTAEAELINAVSDRRAESDDEASLAAANQLIEILRECRHRHDELHRHLIGARTRLREALDDRLSRPPRSVHRFDVASDLLIPCLNHSVGVADAAAQRLLAVVGGLATRWLPSMTTLVDELCAPPRASQPGDQYQQPEFADADQPEWWEPYEDTVSAVFDGIEEPILLSELLSRNENLAQRITDVDETPLDQGVLCAAIVHAAHRAWATQLAGLDAGDPVVLAVATDRHIDLPSVDCVDLLLVPAVVTTDITEQGELMLFHGNPFTDEQEMAG